MRKVAFAAVTVVALFGGAVIGWALLGPGPTHDAAVSVVSGPSSGARPPVAPSATGSSSTSDVSGTGFPAPREGPGARAAVRQTWKVFFSGSTPLPSKRLLLAHAAPFAAALVTVGSSPVTRKASAAVERVRIVRPGTARVVYRLLVGAKVVRARQVGQAAWTDGVWKVGVRSFCGLVGLTGTTTPACGRAHG